MGVQLEGRPGFLADLALSGWSHVEYLMMMVLARLTTLSGRLRFEIVCKNVSYRNSSLEAWNGSESSSRFRLVIKLDLDLLESLADPLRIRGHGYHCSGWTPIAFQ